MGQQNFANNFWGAVGTGKQNMSANTLSVYPFNLSDNISFNFLNFLFDVAGQTNTTVVKSFTASVGLYSLVGGTKLSLTNSISGSATHSGNNAGQIRYFSLSDTSVASNITPGSWWFGFLVKSSATNDGTMRLLVGGVRGPGNAFPGSFTGGRMSVSTAALPATLATSDLDITGSDANAPALIILSS